MYGLNSPIPLKTISSFNKTFTSRLNQAKKREKSLEPFFSKNETLSSFYTPISSNQNFNEGLENLYNNAYYPHSLKRQNYKKEYNKSLPMLTQYNFSNVVSEKQYDDTINKYKKAYINQNDLLENSDRGYTLNNMVNENKLTGDESEFIKKVIKKRSKFKDFSINTGDGQFNSPKHSLFTLKINKALMNRMNCVMSSTQYDSYNQYYNKVQFDKLRNHLMPKPHIKLLQMDHENISDKFSNFLAHNSGSTSNKSINDVIVRNGLIKDTKYYFCKIVYQNNRTPNSRVQATFTKYYNQIYLFGGLSTSILTDVWTFDINTLKWKKLIINQINYNPKYGHTANLFNDCLFLFGGNINVSKIKSPLEDIMIFNLANKQLKIQNFKNEQGKYNKNYFRIPHRRNHISEIVGWNMVVHGGIDIEKEYSNKNDDTYFFPDPSNNIKDNNNVLCDFMMLDLNSLKWVQLNDIRYKVRKKSKTELRRAYHCSCLVLNNDNVLKGPKLNIYYSEFTRDHNSILSPNDPNKNKHVFDPKFEGIYIFGGLDQNLQPTNSIYILHIFKNPLVLFEPNVKGTPPSPRFSSTINYYRSLNYIVLYGGKNLNKVFNDLFILDIMNFTWISVQLFGSINEERAEHCCEIFQDKLFIFGGCNETNFLNAKVFIIELDLFKCRRYKKCYDFAQENLKVDNHDRIAKTVIEKIDNGEDIPDDIYPFFNI